MVITQAFNYEITEFSFGGESLSVNYIKYIGINCMFEANTMATMYVGLHVPAEIYQKIVESEKSDDGFINICIRSKNVYSDTSISGDYIKGRFAYILPTSNPDYSVNLSSDVDKSYKSIVMSLLHKEYLDNMKRSLCGTYKNIDVQDLIRLSLKDFSDVIVQAPTVLDLKKFDSITIPPMNSMKKFIDYIFNIKPFYNTAYTFFADFSRVYLTAHDRDTSSSIGAISEIVFHICSITSNVAYLEGITIPDGADYLSGDTYHVYINPADISVAPNKGMDMISNQLMGVDEEGIVSAPVGLEYGVLNADNSSASKIAVRRGPNTNVQLYANILNSNTVSVEFKKSHLNGAILTPDKVLHVNFELTDGKENYNSLYSGEYYMTYKKEVIRNNSGTFGVSCSVGLKRIGNLSDVVDIGSFSGSSGGFSGYKSSESGSGSSRTTIGTRKSSVSKSAKNVSKTQVTTTRTTKNYVTNTVASPISNLRSKYNLESKSYGGPEYIDRKSSGAVITLDPHITEPRL